VGGIPLELLATSLGYGYATTSYRDNGLVADVAVDDLDDAAAFFTSTFGDPTVTFLVGASEGGLTTALALERSNPGFDGGLILCAPTGSFDAQVSYFGDFRVLFDYYFPGLIDNDANPGNTWRPWGTGGSVLIPEVVQVAWEAGVLPAVIAGQVQANLSRARELLGVAGVAYDASNLATIAQSVIAVLSYNILATNDAVERLGGNPYGNVGRIYWAPQLLRVNLGVRRITANNAARAALASFETTGALRRDAVALHTTGDPVVPFWQSLLYRAEAYGQGIGPLRFNSFPTFSYGHCAFTAEEVLAGFALLVHKVTGASLFAARPSLERIGVDAEQLSMRASEIGAETTQRRLIDER
jgi:hypothetical protein